MRSFHYVCDVAVVEFNTPSFPAGLYLCKLIRDIIINISLGFSLSPQVSSPAVEWQSAEDHAGHPADSVSLSQRGTSLTPRHRGLFPQSSSGLCVHGNACCFPCRTSTRTSRTTTFPTLRTASLCQTRTSSERCGHPLTCQRANCTVYVLFISTAPRHEIVGNNFPLWLKSSVKQWLVGTDVPL